MGKRDDLRGEGKRHRRPSDPGRYRSGVPPCPQGQGSAGGRGTRSRSPAGQPVRGRAGHGGFRCGRPCRRSGRRGRRRISGAFGQLLARSPARGAGTRKAADANRRPFFCARALRGRDSRGAGLSVRPAPGALEGRSPGRVACFIGCQLERGVQGQDAGEAVHAQLGVARDAIAEGLELVGLDAHRRVEPASSSDFATWRTTSP